MKKFFAILLGIVDVFCVGLIFYLMLSNLSGTPAQIFLPILPPTLVAFLAAALIGRLTGPESSAEPKKKAPSFRRRNAWSLCDFSPFFLSPRCAETAGGDLSPLERRPP